MKHKLYRIIDANLNRTREGLRVIEDIVRFYSSNRKLTIELKSIRHKISESVKHKKLLLSNRDSNFDVAKEYTHVLEGRKKDIKDIAMANFRRVEESLRVLEDISKLIIPEKTGLYKKMRFRIYDLEKKIYGKL